MSGAPYVSVADLSRHFDISDPLLARLVSGRKRRVLTAVDQVSFSIAKGQTMPLSVRAGRGSPQSRG